MAILTVLVYRINEKYFPNGCERHITCGTFSILSQNKEFELPAGAPLTCDEDLPDNVFVDLLLMDNGERWWVEHQEQSLVETCIQQQGGGGEIDLELSEDGSIDLPEGLISHIVFTSVGGDEVIDVGNTPAGEEIIQDLALTDGVLSTQNIGYYHGGGLIYFTGITFPTTIKIYKL